MLHEMSVRVGLINDDEVCTCSLCRTLSQFVGVVRPEVSLCAQVLSWFSQATELAQGCKGRAEERKIEDLQVVWEGKAELKMESFQFILDSDEGDSENVINHLRSTGSFIAAAAALAVSIGLNAGACVNVVLVLDPTALVVPLLLTLLTVQMFLIA